MVQRYDLVTQQTKIGQVAAMLEIPDGEWVKESDYANLEARVKELEAESKANREAYEYAWNAYQDLAKISLEDAWIPVEEALPDDYGEVLLVHSIYGIGIGHYSPKLKNFAGVFASVLIDKAEVTHWKRIILP